MHIKGREKYLTNLNLLKRLLKLKWTNTLSLEVLDTRFGGHKLKLNYSKK